MQEENELKCRADCVLETGNLDYIVYVNNLQM